MPAFFRDTHLQDRSLAPPSLVRRHGKVLAAVSVLVVLTGIVASALSGVDGARASVDVKRLSIATVERGRFIRDFAADGKVVAAGSPMLYAPSAGTVTLHAKAGDAVTRGQLLAVLESPELTAHLSQERATLQSLQFELRRAQLGAEHAAADAREARAQAEVDHTSARREFERTRKAYEAGAYAELQVRRAEDALELHRQVEFQVVGELPPESGWVDRIQIEQLLINLLKNARESGSVPKAIALSVTHASGVQRSTVCDRGGGMSETVLAQALLPFYSTKRTGSGLGLALAREIAEAHGGQIRLANRNGGGLEVSVTLPLPERR